MHVKKFQPVAEHLIFLPYWLGHSRESYNSLQEGYRYNNEHKGGDISFYTLM